MVAAADAPEDGEQGDGNHLEQAGTSRVAGAAAPSAASGSRGEDDDDADEDQEVGDDQDGASDASSVDDEPEIEEQEQLDEAVSKAVKEGSVDLSYLAEGFNSMRPWLVACESKWRGVGLQAGA